jgi:alpha-ketoglutarate-dependent taurine dioxygenase
VIQLEPLDATFGARVTGVALPRMDDATFAELYQAWLEYALLIFPDQHLTKEEQVEFAERFGAGQAFIFLSATLILFILTGKT